MLSAHLLRGLTGTAAVLALSLGCAATRSRTTVTEQWRDPGYSKGRMNTLVVLAPNVPQPTRRSVEDRFVNELQDEGVRAAQSYKILGDQPFDRDLARSRLVGTGYDGALIVEFEAVDTTTTPPPQPNFFSAPYHSPWPSEYQAPRMTTEYTMNVDTSLWDLRDDKRVWNATTKVENPVTRRDLAKRMSKKVVAELSSRGLVGQSPR